MTAWFSRLIWFAACSLPLIALAACSSTFRPAEQNTVAAPLAPEMGVAAEGSLVVGVVGFTEPENRSGGVADATTKAAQLAAKSLANGMVTLHFGAEPGAAGAKALGAEFAAAGARIVLGGSDPTIISAVARALPGGTVTTITLAPVSDTGLSLYSAAPLAWDEARALMDEIDRLGLKNVLLVRGQGQESAALAATIGTMSVQRSIPIHIATVASGADLALALSEALPDAVVFAVDPASASRILSELGAAPISGISIAGNAGWTLSEPLPQNLRGTWYPSLPREPLRKFVERFRAAYGETPTLAAAILYDLVILAAVLDQNFDTDAFNARTLKSDLGFAGFTGPFAFGAAGLVQARHYDIVQAR